METVKFKVERVTDVSMPVRAHATDAGIDFYLPNDINYIVENGKDVKEVICAYKHDDGTVSTKKVISIQPQASILIPMGVKLQFPEGYGLILFNRSSVASKKHLYRGACVVDQGYTGLLYVNLTNVSDSVQYLLPGEKLIQGVLLPIPQVEITEGEIDKNTERGEGGFGSTNQK